MSLDLAAVGREAEPAEVSWTADDCALYAMGVGAGQDDPLAELAFTTDNTRDVAQQVLPTFGVVLAQFRAKGRRLDIGTFDPARLVHAEQEVALGGPIPAAGTMSVTSRVAGIYDKGSGALVVTETAGTLLGTSEPLVRTTSAVFIRGEGGFGRAGTATSWARPDRHPDQTVRCSTRADQALLYRLSGDHNPLHTDPSFAARAGFERPILHGMCTYGVTSRVLLNVLVDGQVGTFRSMSARFSRPVYPGDQLHVHIWREPDEVRFVVETPDGATVLDRGVLQFDLDQFRPLITDQHAIALPSDVQ